MRKYWEMQNRKLGDERYWNETKASCENNNRNEMREKNVSRPANEIKGSNRPITFLSFSSLPPKEIQRVQNGKRKWERENLRVYKLIAVDTVTAEQYPPNIRETSKGCVCT